MGTFTKSFGASGGYIASSKQVVDMLRACGHSSVYTEPLSPPICEQILKSMRIIMDVDDGCRDGPERLEKIRRNSIYFRDALKRMGFVVCGQEGSPVIPVMLFHPTKMAYVPGNRNFSIFCYF